MKGKKRFSTAEAAQIRRLLQIPNRTKSTREKLRAHGFYISDWSTPAEGFYVSDFDNLVARGSIVIEDGKQPLEPAVDVTPTAALEQSPRRDEHYILDLCDSLLGQKAPRQYAGFDFLVGDAGTRLPVDAYYPSLRLVVEYHERQHTESLPFFDSKATVSGTTRAEQRQKYDQLRCELLPKHGIDLVEISYSEFARGNGKRLKRNVLEDTEILRKRLLRWIR
jgi:hypothetical protein